jgi:mannose-6-phosphate isomerase-like protein (cupin superfamily)
MSELLTKKSEIVSENIHEERPWGHFEVLRDEEHFKSKVIRIAPGQQISYQSHEKREEHWIIVKGQGEIIIDDERSNVQKGSYVKIPTRVRHRIRNTGSGSLEFIEVQLGQYFGEDDIVRYEDAYGRANSEV